MLRTPRDTSPGAIIAVCLISWFILTYTVFGFYYWFRIFGRFEKYSIWNISFVIETISYGDTLTGLFITALICATGIAALCLLFMNFRSSGVHGDARLERKATLRREGYLRRLSSDPRKPMVLWAKTGKPKARNSLYVQSDHFPHGVMIAPSGGGKGVGFVIPNALTWTGSLIVLDIKKENYDITADTRRMLGDDVFLLNPMHPEASSCYNPILRIAALPDPDARYTELEKIARAFMSISDANSDWTDAAISLFLAHGMLAIERGKPTMSEIADQITEPTPERLLDLSSEVQYPLAKNTFLAAANSDPRTLKNRYSILESGGLSLWVRNPYVRQVTSRNDIDIFSLRKEPTSIYICVAAGDVSTLAPFIRLVFQSMIDGLQSRMPDEKAGEVLPVLFLLDEFQQLGAMRPLLQAFDTIRG